MEVKIIKVYVFSDDVDTTEIDMLYIKDAIAKICEAEHVEVANDDYEYYMHSNKDTNKIEINCKVTLDGEATNGSPRSMGII